MWLASIYFLITVIACVQAMIRTSVAVGGAALVACWLCYFGTAGFVGSFRAIRARQMQNYSARDLIGIGTVAVIANVSGLVLMIWSGFRVGLFGFVLNGVFWMFIGVVIAIITTKKEFALSSRSPWQKS